MKAVDFKDRLRIVRKQHGLKQTDLADTLDVSVDTVRRWEAGSHEPKLSDVVNLASAMGVTVAELIGEVPLPKVEPRPIVQPQLRKKDAAKKIIVQVGSLRVEVPADTEGYAFVERKLGDFKIEDVPQQSFVKSLQVEKQ